MDAVCITTWIEGDHRKGTMCLRYCIASREGDELVLSRTYSTPEGARRAARTRGLTVMPGTYAGHEKARRALGLPPSADFQARARRFKAQPLTKTERFCGPFADSFAA